MATPLTISYHTFAALSMACVSGLLAKILISQLVQPRALEWYIRLVTIICAEYVSLVLVYRLAFHPLAKYPGPLLAACTDWYVVYWIASGSRHLDLHKQHKQHGKYVRFGPSRISINSGAASRDLHHVNSNTFKSRAYSSFKHFFGAEMSLTTVDHRIHAFRRRVNMAALTPAAVNALGSRVTPHVDYLVNHITAACPRDPTGQAYWSPGKNMAHSAAYCIADIMSDVTFSHCLDVQRSEQNRHFIHDLSKGVAGIHLVGHMQSLFLLNLHRLIFRELIAGVTSFMDLSRSFANQRMKQQQDRETRKDDSIQDIWSTLLAAEEPNTGRRFTKEELISEASLFVIGGTDGMITATTSTLFYLLHNPSTLARLTDEIRQAFPVPRTKGEFVCPIEFGGSELQRIRYLFACIDEAMRLSPPVPSILPRLVRPGGIVVDGQFFPAGIDLGIPHYSLHRDEEQFPEPLSYIPERWIPEKNDEVSDQKGTLRPGIGQANSFTPFGAGRGSCIGKYMAYQEMSYILARLIWQFDMRLEPDNLLGEGTGRGTEGRERKNEFQLYCRFVSHQDGPVVQFKQREDLWQYKDP